MSHLESEIIKRFSEIYLHLPKLPECEKDDCGISAEKLHASGIGKKQS